MNVLQRAANLIAVMMLWGTSAEAQHPADTTALRQQRQLDSLAATIRDLQARMDSATANVSGADNASSSHCSRSPK